MIKLAPPMPSFITQCGRRFVIVPGSRSEGRWGPESDWMIRYRGKPAGKLYRDQTYAAPLRWHAAIRELYWSHGDGSPTGVGFDVAAFATAEECVRAFGRSADQILDWADGKPVFDMYGKRHARRIAP